MPFGPYKTFEACVLANSDKRDPEAYCASIERKIKGEMSEAVETHTVEGVEIFAAGNWTDSQGQQREWTAEDLTRLLKNFEADSKANNLPVKVGHTDDAFNAKVADELGIPNSLLTGDDGNGAARLGYISNVRLDGSTLIADLEGVPGILTEMIESGFYNAVSVEIDMPDDEDPHLSGIAILGAELPAVGTLAGLDTANIFSTAKRPWVTLSFQQNGPVQIDPSELALEFADISDKMEEIIRGKKGARMLRAFWSEIRRKMSDVTGKKFTAVQQPILNDGGINKEQDIPAGIAQEAAMPPMNQENIIQEENMGEFVLAPEDLPRLYEALGLDENANIEDVLAAIMAMKGEPMAPPMEEPMLPMAQDNERIAALEAELNQLKGFNKQLQHERLVMTYAKQAAAWVTMSGTPEERGEELAQIHETAGKAIAEKVIMSYSAAHKAAADAGVLRSIGATHRQDEAKPDTFQDKIDSYAQEHNVSFEKALRALAEMPKYASEFKAYTKRVNVAVNGGN